jgi:DNA polymerase III alpha subunit
VKIEYEHPLLEPICRETYGIMVYQEDVSRVAMAMAGFNASDADLLQKILSKKRAGKKLEDI